MLITFEGIDGSGKSTQIALLKETLLNKGLTVKVFREPGGTEVSEYIREILLNTKQDIDPITELLLFSSARSKLISEKVIPALHKGEIIILDRFYDSTTAYQGYGRSCLPLNQIKTINEIASHQTAPDFTFYLRVSIDESNKRRAHLSKDRMESAGNDFFNRVIKGFDDLASFEDRFITIDATQEINEIHDQIVTIIGNKL